MNITCPSCNSRYAVDDSRVPDQGVSIRCPSCKHKFVVKPERDAPVSLPPSEAPRPPRRDDAVALPGARSPAPPGRSTRSEPEDAGSIPLPGAPAAPKPAPPPPSSPAEPDLDELSFPSVSGPGSSAEPFEESLDLGLEDEAPPRAPPRPAGPQGFEPPDDLPGLPGGAPRSQESEPELPDLPGLPEARGAPASSYEHPDLPGLPESPPDLPGLPSADRKDLPGLPEIGRAASQEILGFIDEQAAGVETGAGPGGGEFKIRRRSGRVEGPFGSERILAMIRAGQLTGGEDLSSDGVSWRALTSVPQFNEALTRASEVGSYGEVDLGAGGQDGVAPVGLDLPGPSGLPDRAAGRASDSGLTGDFGSLSLDTGPLGESPEAAALDEVDAMMDGLGDPSSGTEPLGDEAESVFGRPTGGAPLGGGGGTEGGTQDAAREVLEVGEIPELPPIWKTYRKQIIAFSALALVILSGVYTQLFTPYGAFGIPGAVEWALKEPPPPAPPPPPPPAPPKVEAEALASLLREGGYESLRAMIANAQAAAPTPETRLLLAKAAVHGALRFPEAEDFGVAFAEKAVAGLEGQESLDATLARAGLALAGGDPAAALEALPPQGGDAAEAHWLRGLAHERADRPEAAAEAFDGALVADAGYAPAAAGLGRVALQREDQAAAAHWLLRAHSLAPKLGPTGLLAADTLDAADRGGEAAQVRLAVARNADGLAPGRRAPLLARVAAEHDDQGRIEEVADLAIEAARLAPADPAIGALAAAAEIATGKAGAALSRIEGHLKRAPESVSALVARARAHMALQDVAKAFLDLETARELSPRSAEVALWEARFNVQLGKFSDARGAFRLAVQRSKDDMTARISLGRLELSRGDVERAFELAREAVQVEPKNPGARLLLADCLAERGQLEKALESYAKAASEAPGRLAARLGQANMLRAQAERMVRPPESEALGAAFAHYIQVWSQAPENPKVLFELGRALELEGQLGNALSLYQEAAALDAEDVRPHLRMTAAFMEQAAPDLAAAEASLKTAQSIERRQGLNVPEVRFWEARLALAHGRANEAVSSMREAVEAEPKNSLYHYWLGKSLERDNSLYEAVAAYEEAVRLNSRFAAAQRALGWTSLEQHRFKVARRWFNAYRKNEPTDGSIYIDIGTSFTQQNKDGPALRAFQRALDFEPDSTKALIEVGNIFSRRGQERKARRMYERVVELEPDNPEAVCLLGISLATRRVSPESKQYLERCKSMEDAPQDLREAAEDILLTPR